MNETINLVITNLTDGLSQVAASVVVHAVVQDTANLGCMYTIIGTGLFVTGAILIWHLVHLMNKNQEAKKLEDAAPAMVVVGITGFTSLIVGFGIAVAHISDWFGPTKTVFWRLFYAIQ